MRIFIPVDIADFLYGARHFSHASQIIEKHKAGIKVNTLQYIIRHHRFHQMSAVSMCLEIIIQIPDEFVSIQ